MHECSGSPVPPSGVDALLEKQTGHLVAMPLAKLLGIREEQSSIEPLGHGAAPVTHDLRPTQQSVCPCRAQLILQP